MKAHSNVFKDEIKKLGKQIDSIITVDEEEITGEDLYSVTPVYDGGLLKSVMKELDVVTSLQFDQGEELNYKFGLLVPKYERYLDLVCKTYYEEIYAPGKSVEYLKSLATTGIKITLGDMYSTYNEEYAYMMGELLKVCDVTSLITFYPTSPYGVTNYTVKNAVTYIDEEAEAETEYEYLNYGNYTVYETEYNADDKTYSLKCYDKMLNAMKEYEDLNITYPITVRNYINTICTKIGVEFANVNDTFVNYNKLINNELYLDSDKNGLGYTYRDVLDELAQVTASTICINNDDKLELRYVNDTGDIIDEEYIKDIDVQFGEKQDNINVLVLSRSANADNIYYPQVLPENPIEYRISDNQILNGNNRSEFMPEIFNVLQGISYYINDYSSTGICYYDLCDKYTVKIGSKRYQCIMMNDQVNVTQGLEELIFTEKPEETKTDYTKSDTTDIKVNKTTLIVDKQNGQIQSLVTAVGDRTGKSTSITQDLDRIESEISEVADITVSGETDYGELVFTDTINQSEPILVKIRPTTKNISYLYPNTGLYPSEIYPQVRILRFKNTDTNETIDYEIPDDLLYYNEMYYDEFTLDYENQVCKITKWCKYKADGTVELLTEQQTTTYDFPTITLTEGKYTITLLGYANGYLYARLMTSNIYTNQFATKVELNSSITQTAKEINLSVDGKIEGVNKTIDDNYTTLEAKIDLSVDTENLISKINAVANEITITSDNFTLSANGDIVCNNATMNNANVNGNIYSYATGSSIKAIEMIDQNIYFYNWHNTTESERCGELCSTYNSSNKQSGIFTSCMKGGIVGLGYKDSISSTSVRTLISFDTNETKMTPYIAGTCSGTLFGGLDSGGIKVENGLITDWNMSSAVTGYFNVKNPNDRVVKIGVDNGLITSIEVL